VTEADREDTAQESTGSRPARVSLARFRPNQPSGQTVSRSWRRLPGLIGRSVGLLWRATPLLTTVMLILTLLSAAAQGVALLAIRAVIIKAVESAGSGASFTVLIPSVALLATVVGVAAMSQLTMSLIQTLMVEKVTFYAFERVIDVAAAANLVDYDDPGFHDRLARAQNAGGRPYAITQSLLGIARSLSILVSLLYVVFVLQPLLIIPLILMVIPLVLASIGFSKRFYKFTVDFNEHERRRFYLRSLLTSRPTAPEVRAYGLSGHIRERNQALTDERDAELRSLAWKSLPRMAAGGIGAALAIAGSVGFLMALVLDGRSPVATAAVGSLTVFQLSSILTMVSMNVSSLYESALFIDDYRDFLKLLPDLTTGAQRGTANPPDFEEIRVEGVSFTYPQGNHRALDDVSLTLHRGEIVAIVGENGSGKTTLAKLLCQLYSPDSGNIFWDSTDVATIDPDLLLSNISVVFQDFGRYLFTFAENIAIGRIESGMDMPAIEAAAKAAGAEEVAEALPYGYDTLLGRIFEDGAELSVGQWQRIALARAFFRDADLIILDEPTASLDPRAEHALFDSMRKLFAGRTVLLISHRFSSVRSADRIYVMNKGRIAETGTHEQLVSAEGLYAELYGLHAETEDAGLRVAVK
jgi:ATP-binding cassette, subfamily B, bacterial